jgi:hypothetical protein
MSISRHVLYISASRHGLPKEQKISSQYLAYVYIYMEALHKYRYISMSAE